MAGRYWTAPPMSERGGVHVFHPSWTEADPANPGQRRIRHGKSWCWRFTWRGHRESGGQNYHTKDEARDAGERRKAEVRGGMEDDPRKATFAVVERLLKAEAELQKNPGTRTNILAVTKRLKKYFERDRLIDVKRERLIEYVGHMRRAGYQDSTIRHDLRMIKRGLDLAYEGGYTLAVPRFPKIDVHPRQETITAHQLEAIVATMPESWVRYYLAADEMGWRARSEIRTRRWPNVDWGPPTWECRCAPELSMRHEDECQGCGSGRPGWVSLDSANSKSGKPRAFPMTSRLRRVLLEQRAFVDAVQRRTGRDVQWVFCRDDGRQLGDPWKVFASACERAGLGGKLEGRRGPWSSRKVPHDVRRTVLRRWAAMGAQLDARMAAAGHDSTAVHLDYIGGDPETLLAFAQQLDAARRRQDQKLTAK